MVICFRYYWSSVSDTTVPVGIPIPTDKMFVRFILEKKRKKQTRETFTRSAGRATAHGHLARICFCVYVYVCTVECVFQVCAASFHPAHAPACSRSSGSETSGDGRPSCLGCRSSRRRSWLGGFGPKLWVRWDCSTWERSRSRTSLQWWVTSWRSCGDAHHTTG